MSVSSEVKADVLVVGGGGGGGGAYYSSSIWKYNGNGGTGGAVQYVTDEKLPAGVAMAVTVGSAGAGGAGVKKGSSAKSGGQGGGSSFVVSSSRKISATGGAGGAGGTSSKNSKAGSAGSGAGAYNISGMSVSYGAAGAKAGSSQASDVGQANGQGGQGGYKSSTQAQRAGGAGGSGVVIVRLKEVLVQREPIEKPTAATGLVYDGSVQAVVAGGGHYVLGGTWQAKDAGSYEATATPAEGYCWPDKTYGAITLAWSIARRPVKVSVVPTGKTKGEEEPVYQTTAEGFVEGDAAEASWKVWRTNLVEQADGTLGLVEKVGAYDLVVAGTAETANYEIAYENGRGAFVIREPVIEIVVPAAAAGLVYDGSVQTGVPAGAGYALAGAATARDAGDYVATATPKAGYAWAGGSTAAREIAWSISPKAITVTPDAGQEKTVGEAYAISFKTNVAMVGSDRFTGALTAADEVGEQTIRRGTLAIDDGKGGGNYALTVDETVTITVKSAGPSISEGEGQLEWDPATNEVVVRPDEGVTEVEIVDMPDDATAQVPVTVDTVRGVEAEQIVVVAEATNETGVVKVDITAAFDILGTPEDGVTIVLNDDPAAEVEVEIGGEAEKIKVTPELTAAGDAAVEPLAVGATDVEVGVKTIPGLTYALRRSATLGGEAETVASETAKGTRTRLTDPMAGEKPSQAFYVIEVTK